MNTWILVWLFMAGIASLAVIVVLIALVRHAWSVAKTAKRFQAEMAPLTEQLQTLSATAGERSSKIQGRSLGGPRTRPDG